MAMSIEVKATVCAVMAALLSLGGAGLLALTLPTLDGKATAAASAEPAATPELVGRGREFFAMSCSHCHGDDAHGDEGPDLHNLALSNSRIATTVKKGINGEMPSFAKKYDDQQIAALVAYLRTQR